jgi:hypothetical protein
MPSNVQNGIQAMCKINIYSKRVRQWIYTRIKIVGQPTFKNMYVIPLYNIILAFLTQQWVLYNIDQPTFKNMHAIPLVYNLGFSNSAMSPV